jgi:enoyl-CoA hydratase/carnithine racemase
MSMACWTLRQDGNVAVVTFMRPPRNFMSFKALGDLADLLAPLAERDDISVILLQSALPGYLVAHADLNDLARAGRGEPVEGDRTAWRTTPQLLEDLPQPVIAAVDGQAWGGGTELSLACTMRIASPAASFGLPEVSVGQIPGAGGTQRLPRLVGAGRALDIILSGRKIDADEALAIGLVQAILPDEDFAQAALAWARHIARQYRPALVAAKRAVIDGLRLPFAEGLDLEKSLVLPRTADPVSIAKRDALAARYAATPPETMVDF